MLEVKNLTFKVKENGIDRSIVEDISFTVENGEMLVITGPERGREVFPGEGAYGNREGRFRADYPGW